MKHAILVCSVAPPNYIGGLAAYIKTLASSIRTRVGYDVILGSVLPKHPTVAVANEPLDCMLWRAKRPSIWRYAVPLLQKLASRPRLFFMLGPVITGIQFILGFPPLPQDIKAIHFVGTGWDFWGFMLVRLARSHGVPFTIWPAVHPASWGDDMIDIHLYKQADTVFCQSDFERDHLHRKGVPLEKLVRCGLPPMCKPDGNGGRLRTELGIGNHPAVLFLGRRDEGKGYPALLQSWSLVLRSVPDAVLLFGGPGGAEFIPMKDALPHESYRDLGVPNEEMKVDAYSACDVFCLPSAHESFGIVYVEAWSYGKPVICGTAPASRELIESEATGLWSSQSAETLAGHLVHLLSHPEECKRLGDAGQKLQRTRFVSETMVHTHLEAWAK
jgi:glycosyltransferase involved in cell wall biosynthesis